MADKYPSLPDAIRVPLDSLHADAAYLIGRLSRGSITALRVVEIIRERIDAAKAGIDADRASRPAPATASEISDELDVALSRACVKAWDASSYTSGECDAVHPMYAAAFEAGARALLAMAPATTQAQEAALTPSDYEEVLADHRRLVRELDVLFNGDGAAPQASLCDIVAQVRKAQAAPTQADSAPSALGDYEKAVSRARAAGATITQHEIGFTHLEFAHFLAEQAATPTRTQK